MEQEIVDLFDKLAPLFVEYGLKFVGAIVILIVGFAVAKWLGKKVKKALFKFPHIDDTLAPVVGNVVKILVMVITLLAVLNQFGVQTTSIVAVLGAAGLAVGLALQGTLSNVASGVMLLIFRPFKAGDVVKVNGNVCVVDEVGLFLSKFKTPDNLNIYLPNSAIWGSEIQNFSENATRRNDIIIGISYSDDINKAFAASLDEVKKDARILSDPEPMVAVESLGDSSVNVMVRYWTATPDFFQTKLDMTKRLKERFDAEKISIPFPQRDVHVFQSKS
ncbi:mechanosensitive ion channel [bacterium]|nr:MAG: mechanosensitive ion channel [bacterium]